MGAGSEGKTGPYRHLKLVYAGQSSQLWKARDDRDGKTVAIKRLLPESARDHAPLLKKEVQVASALDGNRWVVQIYEMGKDAGIPFLAMEWFPAPSVGQLIKLGYDVYGLPSEGIGLDSDGFTVQQALFQKAQNTIIFGSGNRLPASLSALAT